MIQAGRIILLLSLLTIGVPALAQTRQSVTIEKNLQRRLKDPRYQSTMGMVEAYDEAAKAYAAEIGRVYAKLKAGLPTIQATVLIEGQRSWQTYLKAQRKFTSYVYDADGTIHKPMAMQLLKETLQHRLTELCGFFLRIGPDPYSEDVPGNGDWCTEEHQDLEGPDFLASASRAEGLPHQAGQKP